MRPQRILLLGGGHTHALVLKKLLHHKHAITLISATETLPYTGMIPGYIAGHYTEREIMIDLAGLCRRAGVEFIVTDITGINEDFIRTRAGRIPYHLASLNLGIASATPAGIDDDRSLPLKAAKDFMDGWQRIYPRFKPHTKLAVVGGGAAGLEVALALAWRLRSLPARLVLIAGGSFLAGYARKLVARARFALNKAGIELREDLWVTGFAERMIYARSSRTSTDQYELPADYVFWCVHGAPAAWLRNSALACDDKGFVRVNDCLQSISHPHIFAAGDIAALNLEKAGVFAVRQAPYLTRNLMRFAADKPLLPYQPQKEFLTLLSLGTKVALGQRGRFHCAGTWVWYWKNYLDRRFIKMLNG